MAQMGALIKAAAEATSMVLRTVIKDPPCCVRDVGRLILPRIQRAAGAEVRSFRAREDEQPVARGRACRRSAAATCPRVGSPSARARAEDALASQACRAVA